MSGRFAQQTNVAVEKTRAEIESVLQRYGADGFRYGWNHSRAQIEFVVSDRMVRFTLVLPDKSDTKFTSTPGGRRRRSAEQQFSAWEQECRSLWRALLLAIRAKLEATEVGISEFDQEFFAFIVDPITNRTVYENVKPALVARYEGHDKPLLALPGPTE